MIKNNENIMFKTMTNFLHYIIIDDYILIKSFKSIPKIPKTLIVKITLNIIFMTRFGLTDVCEVF